MWARPNYSHACRPNGSAVAQTAYVGGIPLYVASERRVPHGLCPRLGTKGALRCL